VPRGQSGLTASGLTSAGMMGGRGSGGDQTLDEESAARLAQLKADDEEIDKGLDSISNIVSHLGDIAGDINSEVSPLPQRSISQPILFNYCWTLLLLANAPANFSLSSLS
jgi:hypothetical protein